MLVLIYVFDVFVCVRVCCFVLCVGCVVVVFDVWDSVLFDVLRCFTLFLFDVLLCLFWLYIHIYICECSLLLCVCVCCVCFVLLYVLCL